MRLKFVKADQDGKSLLIWVNSEGSIVNPLRLLMVNGQWSMVNSQWSIRFARQFFNPYN
jgi:hypothetical protein